MKPNFNSQQINVPIGAMLRVADYIETTDMKAIVCGRWGAVDEITLDVEFDEDNPKEFRKLEKIIDEWIEDNEELNKDNDANDLDDDEDDEY